MITDLFEYSFFQRALVGGVLVALVAPLVGVPIVLRRLSMIGDTLAHVTIAGAALGLLINMYPLGVGLVFALLAALAIEKLRSAYRGYAELSIAILMSGGVALASILFTYGRGFNMNVSSYLFGSILSLDAVDLGLMAAVAVLVFAAVMVFRKELFLIAFDEEAAAVSGLPTAGINMLLTVLTALVVSIAIKAMGGLLVSALLTVPVACSLALGKGFRTTVWSSVLFAEIAVVGGLCLAWVWDLAPSGTIVLLLIVMLVVLLAVRRLKR
jgi:zinc transport system permease protein